MRLKPVRTEVPKSGESSADSGGTGSQDHPVCCRPRINGGVIAGGTIAGVVLVVLGILGAVMLRKRQRRKFEHPQVSQDRADAVELSAGGAYIGHGVEGGYIREGKEGEGAG